MLRMVPISEEGLPVKKFWRKSVFCLVRYLGFKEE